MILEETGTERGISPRRSGRNLASWWYDNVTLFSQHGLWSCDSSQTTYSASVHFQHEDIVRSHEFVFSSDISTTSIAMENRDRSEAAKYCCQVMGRS